MDDALEKNIFQAKCLKLLDRGNFAMDFEETIGLLCSCSCHLIIIWFDLFCNLVFSIFFVDITRKGG